MKKLIVVFLTLLVGLTKAQSQGAVASYDNGIPVRLTSYTDVKGSVYLLDDWSMGIVKSTDGKVSKDYKLKYNLVEDQLLFLGKDGETPMKFSSAIKEFQIAEKGLYRNGYPALKKNTQLNYYEVLADGKVQLLKRNNKTITEYREYNSATTTRKIADNFEYYFYKGETIVPVAKDQSVLETIFKDKASAVQSKIKERKLNLKKEADLKEIVEFYNQL